MEPYRFHPSERTAMTIEEFLEGCRAEPMLAADQLHQGYFEPWLRDAGRPDLAEAAVQVRQADIGPGPALEQFLQAATLASPRPQRKRGPAPEEARRALPTRRSAAGQVTRRRRRMGDPSTATRGEVAPGRERVTVTAESGQRSRSGEGGHRFQVTFRAETVVEAADIQDALHQVEALGATEISAIMRQG